MAQIKVSAQCQQCKKNDSTGQFILNAFPQDADKPEFWWHLCADCLTSEGPKWTKVKDYQPVIKEI